MQEYISFCLLQIVALPFRLLPYRYIHKIGTHLGTLAYYCSKKYRKRTLNNLILAKELPLSHKEKIKIAKQSFQNLVITTLEYFRLQGSKYSLQEIVVCDNPEVFQEIFAQNKGVIFLSGHQANWEVPFLYITQYRQGIAIGRPIKNRLLYRWVIRLRQMHGGRVVLPKNAITESIKALKQGLKS